MAVTDIATRTYNHGWRLDPIVRSLLDTDFYKLLMLQMIREFYPDDHVTFSVINRSRHVRLAEVIDEGELRAQLDHARTIRFAKKELIWLAGNTFYGKTQMFSPDFINWLANFRLPEYELHKVDGQYELHFHGPWTHTTMWEIPALAILNELRSRQVMKGQGRFELDVLYARAKAKLWSKVERLRKLEGLRLSDFGTRRRHGFLWQRWCVEAVKEGLGPAFTGTSNVLLAMDNDLEAIGTNAHELPMVAAALANDDKRTALGALSHSRPVAPYLWRQPSDRAARRLRHQGIPARRAGMGGRLDRLSPRQRAADRGRRRNHQMVEAEGPRSRRKSCWCFPTAWMSDRSRRPIAISPAASGSVSAGAPTSPTISSDARRTASADLDPISIVCKVTCGQRPAGGETFGQSGEGDRHPGRSERYLRVFGNAGRVRTAADVRKNDFSRGAWTTAPARCAWWATRPARGWRTGCLAPT